MRRADRPPRLGHRRARARPDRRAPGRARLRARHRDPRRRRRRAGPAGRSSSPTAASSRRPARDRNARSPRPRGARPRSGPDRAAGRRGRRGGRAARGDAALHRQLAAKRLGGAVRSVPLDWQGPVSSAAQAQRAARRSPRSRACAGLGDGDRAVRSLDPHRPGRQHDHGQRLRPRRPARTTSRDIHTFRLLHGSLRPGGVVLDQQLAATLQARIGDTVTLMPRARREAPPLHGHAASRSSPRPTGSSSRSTRSLGPAPAQPPANIAIMPFGDVRAHARAGRCRRSRPPARWPTPSPARRTGVQWQVQAQLDPAPLERGQPVRGAHARRRRRATASSARCPGRVQFVDNLSDSLNTAAQATRSTPRRSTSCSRSPARSSRSGSRTWPRSAPAERDRRDLALLRARGAPRRDLLALAARRERRRRRDRRAARGGASHSPPSSCSSRAARS